ncbi:MAG: YqgE/AlgH family protein [Brachymonas sp.]|nr:YqgE/AlgH family protein [Brachymonas sp.]
MTAAPSSCVNWSQHFLIAMPGMEDPAFARSVVYICEHNADGALGLCINKPLGMTLAELFEQIRMPLRRQDLRDLPVCWGGPVQAERGFILHPQHEGEAASHMPANDSGVASESDADDETSAGQSARWHYTSSLPTPDGLQMTTSRDILEALSEGSGPRSLFAALGYSSWGKGQLEDEVRHNSWLTVPASQALIFDTPLELRYNLAFELLGIAPGRLTMQAGTA